MAGSFFTFMGAVLRSRRLRIALVAAHVLAIVLSFWIFRSQLSPDRCTYRGLADGLSLGVFSYWNGLVDPAPLEVYRTHGYPVFLWTIRQFSHNVLVVKVVQSLMHAAAIWWLLCLLARWRPGDLRAQNLLLLFILPDVPLLMYPQLVFPETLMELICVATIWAAMTPLKARMKWIVLGALMAISFWVRPVMALFPAAPLLFDLVFLRGADRLRSLRTGAAAAVLATVLGPLAFGWWNLKQHGVFRPVPLGGSSVVSNMGIWQLRLPGYGTMHYFRWTRFGGEIVQWADPDEAAANYVAYEKQWNFIDSVAMLHATPQDLVALEAMVPHLDSLFATRSPQLSMAYDSLVAAANRRMIRDDPGYWVASRIYTAARLWITNVNIPMAHTVWVPKPGDRPVFGELGGVGGWARALAPFLTTVLLFGVGLPLLIINIWRRRKAWAPYRYALALITYVWLVHVPMSIQSRYTIPVHVLVFFCYALALTWPKPAPAADQA